MSGDTSFLPISSNSSLPSIECSSSSWSISMFTAFSVTHILLIFPLFTVVLYLGYQRWRQQRYISTAAAATSHADIFTYHILVMEVFMVLGCLSYCVGAYTHLSVMMKYGLNIFFSIWSTKIHFHTLTCVEQYLAVVHPVTYLGLKNTGGVRIRNCGTVCVWLCFGCGVSVPLASDMADIIVYYCLVAFAVIVVCFCCTSVLCILRRPGPGQVGRHRERVDQKKRRAFYTIVIIMGVLLLSLGGMLVGGALNDTLQLSINDGCVGATTEVWFSLPSSLVLPLLYLHRAGKLPGCKHISESG